jgi:hypothetical protein
LAACKQYADDHNIWDHVNALSTVAPSLTSAQCKESFDATDQDLTTGMMHAEKGAKQPAGKYAWSTLLAPLSQRG